MTKDSIIFPGLNITLENVGQSIDPFGFSIAFYGMIIALGMVIAFFFIQYNSKRYGENPEDFSDMFLYGIVSGVIGARLYYVIFAWDLYRDNPLLIFNLRQGGLAIFGGIIAGVLSVYIFTKVKKIPFFKAGDIVIPGVLIGQIMGRWGNFFNREAFGDYSDGLLRMGLPIERIRSQSDVTEKMLEHIENIDGIDFIFVHPTFLYESFWNLCLLIIILIVGRKAHKTGLCAAIYFVGYGIGRFFIERLRTDQLLIPHTKVPVSMVVAVLSIGFAIYILLRKEPEDMVEQEEVNILQKPIDKNNP